ncbi:hypothetical protein PsorP6_001759 [Peronosclerospora sorghi]|uniref:Uncharacterized protein n=1 Tax=Peronosclerospora sorghi TaxID=230839 RepID=A0ACC0WU29_9STRA|nr:hypothetical protein PsorP6_001759 [Peronosclerospora sorghi]
MTTEHVTAVATLGDVGAAYAVYEKNWRCADCNHDNYARRARCFRCRAPKVERPDAYVVDSVGDQHAWREALDPVTKQLYYYHLETHATQWARPREMGAAPHATGWFGRGQAGHDDATRVAELDALSRARPARKQLEAMPTAHSHLEGAYEYNIWYDKYVGDHWHDARGQDAAATRCVLARDAGTTKADRVTKANRAFCLHFARGMCARGAECNYYHRLPTLADEVRMGMMHDCFGRARHATDRDDMDGVGNFTRHARTLYVGGLHATSSEDDRRGLRDQEAALATQFGEWGEVENINVIARKAIAFVRFRHRASAEFAKEAMANQSLQGDDVLHVRWAFDDPNPVAKHAADRADRDALLAMMHARGTTTTTTDADAAFDYPETYALPAPKRPRIEGDVVTSYPDTDAQFPTADDDVGLSYAEAAPAAHEDRHNKEEE